MTLYLLVGWRWVFIVPNYLESNSNLCHFLTNGILPPSVAIFLVNTQAVGKCLGHYNPKLVGVLVILVIYGGDDTIPLLEGVWYPPSKCWFNINAMSDSIVRKFHRIGLFQISQSFP